MRVDNFLQKYQAARGMLDYAIDYLISGNDADANFSEMEDNWFWIMHNIEKTTETQREALRQWIHDTKYKDPDTGENVLQLSNPKDYFRIMWYNCDVESFQPTGRTLEELAVIIADWARYTYNDYTYNLSQITTAGCFLSQFIDDMKNRLQSGEAEKTMKGRGIILEDCNSQGDFYYFIWDLYAEENAENLQFVTEMHQRRPELQDVADADVLRQYKDEFSLYSNNSSNAKSSLNSVHKVNAFHTCS